MVGGLVSAASGDGTDNLDANVIIGSGGSNISKLELRSANVMYGLSAGKSDDAALKFTVRADATATPTEFLEMFQTIIQPTTDASVDLGRPTRRWKNIYSADLQLSNEGTEGNEVDGTTGSWTIQEGEDDLYLLNRKNGKKYRFKLEEII